MSKQFVLTSIKNIKTGFLYKEDKIEEIRCYESDSLIGNIYVGRISNILKNINAIFVDISSDISCYLPMEDVPEGFDLKIGSLITVQIVKDKIKSKQPTVTTNLSITGNSVVVNTSGIVGVSTKIKDNSQRERLKNIFNKAIKEYLNEDSESFFVPGGILRTNSIDISELDIINEIKTIVKNINLIIKQAKHSIYGVCIYEAQKAYLSDTKKLVNDGYNIITDLKDDIDLISNCGDNITIYEDNNLLNSVYNINGIIKKALQKNAYMKSGAYLVIEPTEAMTVIDVNSGKAIKGNNKEDIVFRLNVEAAKEIARQLKIRNLSGIIIIDFISMKSEHQNKLLLDEFKKYVESDSVAVQVVDITRLGLVEVTRKKVRKPIYQVFGSL